MTGPLPATPATRDHSYNPGNCRRTFEEEVVRLRAQVELSWVIEQRRLVGLGVADGQQVLEPGCGPGLVTERLATWLPSSRIVALDADLRMLHVARQSLQHRRLDHRISLLQASIAATGLRANTFDVAISRYLFQHLEAPVAAAAEIRRVLRPGGIHIVIDIDDGLWGLVEPRFPEFEVWHRRRAEAQSVRGGNRFRGRRLGRILREAGYTEVQLDVFAYHSDQLGLDVFAAQLDPKQFLPLLNEGFLTVAEYARAQALYQRFLRSSEAFVLSVGFIAYGKNP